MNMFNEYLERVRNYNEGFDPEQEALLEKFAQIIIKKGRGILTLPSSKKVKFDLGQTYDGRSDAENRAPSQHILELKRRDAYGRAKIGDSTKPIDMNVFKGKLNGLLNDVANSNQRDWWY